MLQLFLFNIDKSNIYNIEYNIYYYNHNDHSSNYYKWIF